MTEPILLKTRNKREYNIVYKPRDGSEMEKAIQHKAPIYKYSDLCKIAEQIGTVEMLNMMFKRSKDNIILLQDPKQMNSGHWISVSQNPVKKEIYFFSTYGGRPDREKLQWIAKDDLLESGQKLNIFNDALHEYQKNGWEIHYNNFPYQTEGDNTAYCGIYTVAFLRSKKNPDEFLKDNEDLMRRGKNPAVYYFDRYFS